MPYMMYSRKVGTGAPPTVQTEHVFNGDFSAPGYTDWTRVGGQPFTNEANGWLTVKNDADQVNDAVAYQAISVLIGTSYDFSGSVIGSSDGALMRGSHTLATSGVTPSDLFELSVLSGPGTVTTSFVATSTTFYIYLLNRVQTASYSATFDNISLINVI